MATAVHDLPTETLAYIAKRLNRLFGERELWPFSGLQYRLGEVGQNRIEPRALSRALAELANNRRPRRGQLGEPGPWEPVPGIFASSGKTLEEAYDASMMLLEKSRPLREVGHGEVLDRLRAVVEGATGTFVLEHGESEAPRPLAKHEHDSVAFGMTYYLICRRRATAMWLTHETEWLYPDDPHLWAFLGRCLEEGTRPLIVARHIH